MGSLSKLVIAFASTKGSKNIWSTLGFMSIMAKPSKLSPLWPGSDSWLVPSAGSELPSKSKNLDAAGDEDERSSSGGVPI